MNHQSDVIYCLVEEGEMEGDFLMKTKLGQAGGGGHIA
jgi:hypothetical protein